MTVAPTSVPSGRVLSSQHVAHLVKLKIRADAQPHLLQMAADSFGALCQCEVHPSEMPDLIRRAEQLRT